MLQKILPRLMSGVTFHFSCKYARWRSTLVCRFGGMWSLLPSSNSHKVTFTVRIWIADFEWYLSQIFIWIVDCHLITSGLSNFAQVEMPRWACARSAHVLTTSSMLMLFYYLAPLQNDTVMLDITYRRIFWHSNIAKKISRLLVCHPSR